MPIFQPNQLVDHNFETGNYQRQAGPTDYQSYGSLGPPFATSLKELSGK